MDDPSRYSISRAAKSHLPIFLPWQQEQKRIATGFESTALEDSNNPWKQTCPFTEKQLSLCLCETSLGNGIARDVEGYSTSNSISSEHFSGRLGISIGNAALKVGVGAQYDRQMDQSVNASRASHNGRYVTGRVILMEDPPFSATAKALLLSVDGARLFREQYGDYFVAGYVLGAEAGGCLAASSSSEKKAETTTITVSVQVLWSTFTTSTSTTNVDEKYSMDLAFHGYDTLDGTSLTLHAKAGEPTAHIREAALVCMEQSKTLQQRLDKRFRGLGFSNMGITNVEQAIEATNAGMVLELILVPFRNMKEYVKLVQMVAT